MKRPWRKRDPIKTARSFVTEQTMPPTATKTPPAKMIGRMGNLSAKKPKGRMERAMPKMTAETLKETRTKSAENSLCRIGNTGWVT